MKRALILSTLVAWVTCVMVWRMRSEAVPQVKVEEYMEEALTCACGNKYLMPMLQMDKRDGGPLNEEILAYCVGCTAVWRRRADQWTREIASSNLQALRHLSQRNM